MTTQAAAHICNGSPVDAEGNTRTLRVYMASRERQGKGSFREVVMRRLSTVQEQKKSLNSTPLRYSSSHTDSWKAEKDILMEMLEKTQKLQISAQLAWNQERETWEKQYNQLETSSKAQLESLKIANDRLSTDLAKLQANEKADLSRKNELNREMKELMQKQREKEMMLLQEIEELKGNLEESKLTVGRLREEIEKNRHLSEEKLFLLESKSSDQISSLRKEISQFQGLVKEKDDVIKNQAQEAALTRSLLETLKRRKVTKSIGIQSDFIGEDVERQKITLDITLVKAGKEWEERQKQLENTVKSLEKQLLAQREANESLQTALIAAQQPVPETSLEGLLTHVAQVLRSFLLRKDLDLPEIAKSISQLLEMDGNREKYWVKWQKDIDFCTETAQKMREFLLTYDKKAKIVIELYASSLKVLLETARSIRPGSEQYSLLLQSDNEKLRKERDFLLNELQSQGDFSRTQQIETVNALLDKLSSVSSLLPQCSELYQSLYTSLSLLSQPSQPLPISLLQQLLTLLQTNANPDITLVQHQKNKLETAFRRLKAVHEQELERLSGQFSSFQTLVQAERNRIRETIGKIAEAVEYRQDIWEQFESSEGREREEMAAELERQTLWEIQALAGLVGGLEEERTPPPAADATVIKEVDEEDEEDPAPVVVRLG